MSTSQGNSPSTQQDRLTCVGNSNPVPPPTYECHLVNGSDLSHDAGRDVIPHSLANQSKNKGCLPGSIT